MFIGIDPGLKGGLAACDHGVITSWTKMPLVTPSEAKETTISHINEWSPEDTISPWKIKDWVYKNMSSDFDLLCMENVHGIRGQSASAAFNFGCGVGIIIGTLESLEIDQLKMSKQKWAGLAGLKAGASKKDAIDLCEALWPGISHLGQGKFTDGPAEACLIAYAGWKFHTQTIANQLVK